MRVVIISGAILFASVAAHAESMPATATAPGSANSVSNVLLARLAGIQPFSTGSSSPTQRDLGAESTAVQDNTIYYSDLSLSTSTALIDTSVSTENDLGFTDPGGVDVVSGGSTSIQQNSLQAGAVPTTPSPASASLALLGLAAIIVRRR